MSDSLLICATVALVVLALAGAAARTGQRLSGSRLATRLAAARRSPRVAGALAWFRRLLVIATVAAAVSIPVAGVSGALGDYHGTDLLDFNAPQAQCVSAHGVAVACVGNYYGAYPWGSYDLDEHIDGISVGLTSGVDLSGLPALAFYAIAWLLWEIALLGLHLAFLVFGFAFNLNLISTGPNPGGPQFAHGFGLLDALRGSAGGIFHAGAFQQVLFVSFAAIGLYALWNGLLRARYVQTLAQVGISLLIYALALGIIAAPASTIGWAADTTNQAADGILSIAATVAGSTPAGGAGGGNLQTRRGPLLTAQDALFKIAVFEPFEILDFGGLEHCAANAAAGQNNGISVADRVQAPNGCAPYTGASQITHAPISNEKYASWFLEAGDAQCALALQQAALLANAGKLVDSQHHMLVPEGSNPSCKIGPFDGHPDGANAPNIDPRLQASLAGPSTAVLQNTSSASASPVGGMRDEIFKAIEETAARQQSAAGIQNDPLGVGLQKALAVTWPDTPAVDAQLKEAQGQRLAVAVLVLLGSVPLMIVLGGLSLGVVLAQLTVLFGLVLLPVVLLAGLFPGRGHQLFYEWGKRMLSALLRKFLYALVLIVLLAIEFALTASTAATGFGWLFSYLLQVAFFWLVLMKQPPRIGVKNRAGSIASSDANQQGQQDEYGRGWRACGAPVG